MIECIISDYGIRGCQGLDYYNGFWVIGFLLIGFIVGYLIRRK